MPIYEYICGGCGEKHEAMQKLSDKPLRKCPKCGANKMKKALSLSGFQLKGGGWYKDGYSSAKASSSETSTTKPAESTKAEKPAKEAKAEKKETKAST
ncbi:MAG: zinc ribbon domain-containing protein [Deltaproteobacteria bacterium]|nr:MAG: zinc ribbon domain-containing protein [Deltaproteobacteria bacterium]